MPNSQADRTREPETMTTEERLEEVVGLLALGVVRAVRQARRGTSFAVENDESTSLELRPHAGLSVAPRPRG
jgi:hypothetical protein